jgi:menaquinone-dependent protoporphyrinogen oxidase
MNTPKVLVAYGSRSGSTAGIAEIIGTALESEGFAVDVRDIAAYDAVVLGGALYAGRWHADARRFVRRHAAALRSRPVWLFSSGPLDDSADTKDIPPGRQAAKAAEKINARGHVTFGGRLTSDARGLIARSMIRQGRGGDFRNPQRITEWSRKVAVDLRG